jgi:hypothetical protein
MAVRGAVVLLLIFFFSGCSSPPAPPIEAPETASIDVLLEPTNCALGLVIITTSLEQAQRALPQGFVARDAQAVFGTPVAMGRGAMLLGNVQCTGSGLSDEPYGWAELLIAVEAPRVQGLEPVSTNYYAALMYATPGPVGDLFNLAGWPLLDGPSMVTVTPAAVGGWAQGKLEHGGQIVWQYSLNGAMELTFIARERIWHAADDGLMFLENDYSNRAWLGVAQCSLPAGGAAASLVGVTSCPLGDSVGAVVPKQSWKGRFVTLPGVTLA